MAKKQSKKKETKIVRYSKNPFLNMSSIKTKNQRIVVGKGDNVIIDKNTGEEKGTVIASFREVDPESFVKIFAQNIGMMMNFNASGVKAFTFLVWVVGQSRSIGKDKVMLDQYSHEDFMKEQPDEFVFSIRSMRMGISQLEDAKIIAKAQRRGQYYLNPHFMFNGDRITFAQQIRMKDPYKDETQTDVFDEAEGTTIEVDES